jgi:GH15 family glucan-1,4-alpha-glucosidase
VNDAAAQPYLPIEDYALIGDCHSTALVSRHGSIDWACLRRFDHASTFARLLDHDNGGHYSIRPADQIVEASRRYRPGTMVLETTMATTEGTIVITDAFAMDEDGSRNPTHQLLRSIHCTDGELVVEVTVRPRFDYGSTTPWLRRHRSGSWSAIAGDDAIVVHADRALDIDLETGALRGKLTMRHGERVSMVLVSQPAYALDPGACAVDALQRIDDATAWWTKWSGSTTVDGPHRELLGRSALVLKSLCCAPTGAIIAAPTTSLPEVAGGQKNWDYRACWIRDATLTLDALTKVGHTEVAQGFRTFIMRTAAGSPREMQIMYGPYGERRLPEFELDLAGWRGSKPVRIGNAAASQTQLDVYGHLIDAVHLWHSSNNDIDEHEWSFIKAVIEQAIDRWREPDAGIWELRGAPKHYVHSKAMVWVAVDRGIRLVIDQGFDGVDLDRWASTRDEIRQAIDQFGVHPVRGHFIEAFGTEAVDASLLKLALVGFVDPRDERMIKTVAAIERDLGESNGFLRRAMTDPSDSLGASEREGVFLLCSFWLVEVLAMQGRIADAQALFEKLIGTANDVGLFAEEYDVRDGTFLGNFPQAFTHLGLIAAEDRLRQMQQSSRRARP